MPTNPKIAALLDLLKNGTETRRLQWQTTPDGNTFRVALAHGMVRLSRNESESPEPLQMNYTLTILDRSGQLIDDYIPGGEEEKAAFAQLFGMARRSALNLDDILDDMLEELKSRVG